MLLRTGATAALYPLCLCGPWLLVELLLIEGGMFGLKLPILWSALVAEDSTMGDTERWE